MDRIGLFSKNLSTLKDTGNVIREGKKQIRKTVQKTLDEFIPISGGATPEIKPDSADYKKVTIENAAKMIGYFTQKMENQGFPWKLYKPTGKRMKKTKAISEFEALQRLERNEPVVFQPMRVIGLGFNPPAFQGKDITGKQAAGKLDVKPGGKEIRHGMPIQVNNKSELKFLFELYNPDVKIDEIQGSRLKKAARELAFFTKGTMGTQYPWKMFKNEGKFKKIVKMTGGAIKRGIIGMGLGAGAASLFTIPAAALGAAAAGPIGLAAGAAIGGAIGGYMGAKKHAKGTEINAFEALARLNNDEPVHFQELKKREIGLSIPFPIGIQLGSLSFYSNHGEESELKNLDELSLFNKMQEQK